jgi:hypothetical protein
VVSYYNWKKYGQKKDMPNFKTWVMCKTHRLPMDARLYFEGDRCLMDEVLDYNEFIAKFTGLCTKLGVPFQGEMPREKTDITRQKVDALTYYDDESREKIASLFKREIQLMRYTFTPYS